MNADFLGLGVLLRGEPGNLLLQLLDALLQLIFLPEPRLRRSSNSLRSLASASLHVGIVELSASSLRHRDCVGAVAFGGETSLARIEFGESLGDDREIGAGHGLVEPDQEYRRP